MCVWVCDKRKSERERKRVNDLKFSHSLGGLIIRTILTLMCMFFPKNQLKALQQKKFSQIFELIVGCVCVCGEGGGEFQVALKFEYNVCLSKGLTEFNNTLQTVATASNLSPSLTSSLSLSLVSFTLLFATGTNYLKFLEDCSPICRNILPVAI